MVAEGAREAKMDEDAAVPDADIIARVNRDLLVTTPLAPADLLFVFGSRHAVPAFVEHAAALWREGFCRWVLVTGGMTPDGDLDEATDMSRRMIAAGVPAEAVLIERRATNTGENVIFSLPIIEARLGLENVRSLIALGKATTSARYLMTLQRHWPQVRKMLATVNHLPHPIEEWPRHPALRAKVLEEWRKLDVYRAAGFIADLP
jgi:uncharacterized SAM-binding protein YcdF (DUF218 family)